MFDAICPAVYKQLRLRAGLTQAQLGTMLDTSRMTVVRFESGRARPDKEQERKLKELANCSDVEFAELVCEQLSERIDQRVGIHQGDAYQPSTALAAAQALITRHAREIRPRHLQVLRELVSLAQSLEVALGKCNASLLEQIRICRDRLQRDRSQQAC